MRVRSPTSTQLHARIKACKHEGITVWILAASSAQPTGFELRIGKT